MSSVDLTPTQKTVLRWKKAGLKNADVAVKMTVSKRTVDFHLANIYQRLQVNNLTQALNSCEKLGIKIE